MIKLNDSYLGFTNNVKPLQKGKIEKSLDMLVRYNDQVMKEKEYVIGKLLEGYKPAIEENYSTWSRKLDGMTKPKTRYYMENEEGYSTDINKTLYNFVLYVIENNFITVESINNYVTNETQEKAEQLRIEQEIIRKEREEKEMQRQKEEQERKAQFEIKRQRWNSTGKALLNTMNNDPITEVLNKHDNELSLMYGQYEDFNKDNFYNRFIELLGNPDYCIYLTQEYVENENEENKREYTIKSNPIQTLERDILFNAFKIDITDNNRTIKSKINVSYNHIEMTA
jgi:hypothetical protein